MNKRQKKLVLTKDDHAQIMSYVKRGFPKTIFNRNDARELELELKKARIVNTEELPTDVVRLNSTVVIKEEKQDKMIQLTVVTPEKADNMNKKISILSPIGTALIGFRKGEKVRWKAPAGTKTFMIMDVYH